MANYELLKQGVTAVIKENGNQEITGQILQQTLLSIINSLGSGYLFIGVATPATNPGTPDQNVAYIANGPGTYTNFGGLVVTESVAVLKWNGSWSKEEILSGLQFGGVISPGDTPSPSQPTFYLAGPGTYNEAGLTIVGAGCVGVAIYTGSAWVSQVIDTGLTAVVEESFKRKQELLVAGAAEGLLGPSAATGLAQVLTAPSSGVSIVDAIKGRTLKWNQKITNGNFANGTNGWEPFYSSLSAADNVLTIEKTSNSLGGLAKLSTALVINTTHKYYVSCLAKTDTAENAFAGIGFRTSSGTQGGNDLFYTSSNTFVRISGIASPVNDTDVLALTDGLAVTPIGTKAYFKNVVCIDLTEMFGAGYEPSTVADFEALFPEIYYATNAGTLLPFKGAGIKVTGFNQWDEQWENGEYNSTTGEKTGSTYVRTKNYIPVIPGQTYYFYKGSNWANVRVFYYDINKNYIGYNYYNTPSGFSHTMASDVYFITFYTWLDTTYNHDICINLSDPSRNGQYEPYTETLVNIDAIGKTAKDSDGNPIVPFPTGVNGDGTTNDEYGREGGTERYLYYKCTGTENIDLSSKSVGAIFFNAGGIGKKSGVVICPQYGNDKVNTSSNTQDDNTFRVVPEGDLCLKNTSAINSSTTLAQAQALIAGLEIVTELATPVPFTWDEPFTLAFSAEEGGTIWLQPEGVDAQGVPATAPLNADIAYTVPAGSIITETTLRNLLDEFKAKGIFSAYTMTPDGAGNFNFTITI